MLSDLEPDYTDERIDRIKVNWFLYQIDLGTYS
jgi:hypothetical protein